MSNFVQSDMSKTALSTGQQIALVGNRFRKKDFLYFYYLVVDSCRFVSDQILPSKFILLSINCLIQIYIILGMQAIECFYISTTKFVHFNQPQFNNDKNNTLATLLRACRPFPYKSIFPTFIRRNVPHQQRVMKLVTKISTFFTFLFPTRFRRIPTLCQIE